MRWITPLLLAVVAPARLTAAAILPLDIDALAAGASVATAAAPATVLGILSQSTAGVPWDITQFYTLVAAYPDILHDLGGDAVTAFAFTDAAVAAYLSASGASVADLAANRALLDLHILPAVVYDPATSQGMTSVLGSDLAAQTAVTNLAPGATQRLVATKASSGVVVSDGRRRAVIRYSLRATNGVVHVIDTVLQPPAGLLETAAALHHDAWRAAVDRSGFAAVMRGLTDATYFLPRTAAAWLAEHPLTDLALQHLLVQNVVASAGPYFSTDFTPAGTLITTENGGTVNLTRSETGALQIVAGITVTTIVQSDILLSNGVLHITDSFILPQ
ncbi:hypothetical protein CXG81DRAFT_25481 [Caulochytrium protostelioides]|uniref:FAS1 domain-containing protein n=1 Tax=Caulochytrium protostelioides TaxID=1555241 RepID=A0A4P9X977_9FUNG|nr:hypothetical protein CXG81DRAFT_25481 [Caulochytrium protostelioides]|eukprot:RKP01848.1 hypothetical protein CXG81DRAFT_25481 [Caulochytrium protostelioides]